MGRIIRSVQKIEMALSLARDSDSNTPIITDLLYSFPSEILCPSPNDQSQYYRVFIIKHFALISSYIFGKIILHLSTYKENAITSYKPLTQLNKTS